MLLICILFVCFIKHLYILKPVSCFMCLLAQIVWFTHCHSTSFYNLCSDLSFESTACKKHSLPDVLWYLFNWLTIYNYFISNRLRKYCRTFCCSYGYCKFYFLIDLVNRVKACKCINKNPRDEIKSKFKMVGRYCETFNRNLTVSVQFGKCEIVLVRSKQFLRWRRFVKSGSIWERK